MAANPRTAARTTASNRAKPPARPRVQNPADNVTDADAQEIEAEGHYVTAEMCGEELRIMPPGGWRLSFQRLLNAGQIDAFAEQVLHSDDYDLFLELDPTADEFQQFIADAAQQSGESLGKSSGPSRSGRPTRRR